MKKLFKPFVVLMVSILFISTASGNVYGYQHVQEIEQSETAVTNVCVVNYTDNFPYIPFVRIYGPQMFVPVKGNRVTHRAFLPVVRMTDGGAGSMADALQTVTVLATVTPPSAEEDGGTQVPGHTHNWRPVYRYVDHPAEYEEQCHDGPGTDQECAIAHFICNDTGKEWTWDSCRQSRAELGAIIAEINTWIEEQARNGGQGSYRQWNESYTLHIPGPTVCENVLIRAAWREQILDHWVCDCGEVRYP